MLVLSARVYRWNAVTISSAERSERLSGGHVIRLSFGGQIGAGNFPASDWRQRDSVLEMPESDARERTSAARPSNLNTFLTALFGPAIFLNSVFASARRVAGPWYPLGKNLRPSA
jgi:hypothetical protein